MFRLIKWIIIISIVVAIWYFYALFKTMEVGEKEQIKKDALEAIESGNVDIIAKPLSEKLKEDLDNKKADLYSKAKIKLKELINDLLE